MPTFNSLTEWYDRLCSSMPDWRVGLIDQNGYGSTWLARWTEATGASRRSAYDAWNVALELDHMLFVQFADTHRELHGQELLIAHNRAAGVPCRWLGEAA